MMVLTTDDELGLAGGLNLWSDAPARGPETERSRARSARLQVQNPTDFLVSLEPLPSCPSSSVRSSFWLMQSPSRHMSLIRSPRGTRHMFIYLPPGVERRPRALCPDGRPDRVSGLGGLSHPLGASPEIRQAHIGPWWRRDSRGASATVAR